MSPHFYSVKDLSDAYFISQKAKEFAFQMNFSEFECGMIGLATSEITTNVIRHATEGTVNIRQTNNNKGIEVIIEDKGLGIKNITEAISEGFSTFPGGLGLGLGAVQRSIDEMIINKSNCTGTSITLRHYLPLSIVILIATPSLSHMLPILTMVMLI